MFGLWPRRRKRRDEGRGCVTGVLVAKVPNSAEVERICVFRIIHKLIGAAENNEHSDSNHSSPSEQLLTGGTNE